MNKSILMQMGPSHLFSETIHKNTGHLSDIAALDSDVMFIECEAYSCTIPATFIKTKHAGHSVKEEHTEDGFTSKRTTRKNYWPFFPLKREQRKATDIAFNRQACVISQWTQCLSAELSRMRDDGLINYNKNHFELL